ncbi:MAG: Rpp14/Pop5 family protein [Candidatus Thermoplasmatota archaeon]|nr:Rpp14/Pop5 family protein [Candidatus Thermoplasmatota archaeon]
MTRDFRPRYILFTITADEALFPFQRNQMINALRSHCDDLFGCVLKEKNIYLTRFNGKKGVVRCEHTSKEDTITLLQSITQIANHSVTVETHATSGTIKSLLRKHDTDNSLSS